MNNNKEHELRLQPSSPDADALTTHPLLFGVPATHEHLVSIYYDTEDLALHKLGVSLQTRWAGGQWVQILEDGDTDTLLAEQRIEGREVDYGGLPVHGKTDKRLAEVLSGEPLQALFHVERQRSVQVVALEKGAQIGVILDRGRIRVEEREEPFQELRLTLLSGIPQDLYALALQLAQCWPLAMEDGAAAARGYALLTPALVTHHKAAPVQLADSSSAEEAFILIARGCLDHLRANLAAARAGQPEGIHQMRVALRRLRSVLKVFRPLIPKEASADLVAEIRWLNGFLGPVRDWDVFMEEGLNLIGALFPAKRRLQTLRRQAEAIRQGHYQALHGCLDEPRYHRLILRLYGWLAGREWRQVLAEDRQEALVRPVADFATPSLKKAQRRVIKQGKRFAELTTQERHALRIRIKRLRYNLEFFSSLYPAHPVAAYRRALTRLQDTLGVLNDVMTAGRLLDEAKLGPAIPTRHLIEGWYACKLDLHEQGFPKAWKKFRGRKRPWK